MDFPPIAYKVQVDALTTFAPGERANLNWITKLLYECQADDTFPSSELAQDIFLVACRIQPNKSQWCISREQYDWVLLSKDLDPQGKRLARVKSGILSSTVAHLFN